MAKSTKPAFPLHLHATGQWRKKIKGKHFYFGTDPDKALERYQRERPYLERGELPPLYPGDRCTLVDVCEAFLADRDAKRKAGEISGRTFIEYQKSAQRMCDHFGKATAVDDLTPARLVAFRRELSKTRNSNSLGNEVNRCRVILRFGFENGFTDSPMRFGDFRKPQKRAVRRERAAKGSRLVDPATVRKLVSEADSQLRAMILLAVNCGFGNHDVGTLPWEAVDLDGAWINFPRPKTGVPRRCKLWSETVEALRVVRAERPEDRLVFRTSRGNPWSDPQSTRPQTAICQAFRKLARPLGIDCTFYDLRHTFATVAEESGDHHAKQFIMGHSDGTIAGVYRERMADERLERVAEHVHGWLWEGGDHE